MALPADARVLASDEAFLAAIFRNVYLTAWWGDTTVARLRKVGELQSEVVRKCPKGFVALALIRSVNANLPADVRAEAERLTKEPPPGLRAIAQVIYGSGFAGAAIRSVATGMQLISRQPRPSKVFDTLEHATSWLAPRMNELPDPRGTVTADDVTLSVRAIVAHAAPSVGPTGVAPW
jgi:hypothetical protein